MSVYVDDPIWPFRGMMMCHMIADTPDELHAMADKIGMQRKHRLGIDRAHHADARQCFGRYGPVRICVDRDDMRTGSYCVQILGEIGRK